MRKVLFIGFLLIQSALLAQPGQFDYVQTDQVFSGISGSNANLVLYGAGAGSILLPDYAGVGDRILQVDATGLVSATSAVIGDFLTVDDIGSTVQAWDTDLDALAALATTGLVKRTGAGAFSTITDNSSNWDAAYNDKINSAAFNTGTGDLTLTQQDAGTVVANLDGRYIEEATFDSTWVTITADTVKINGYFLLRDSTFRQLVEARESQDLQDVLDEGSTATVSGTFQVVGTGTNTAVFQVDPESQLLLNWIAGSRTNTIQSNNNGINLQVTNGGDLAGVIVDSDEIEVNGNAHLNVNTFTDMRDTLQLSVARYTEGSYDTWVDDTLAVPSWGVVKDLVDTSTVLRDSDIGSTVQAWDTDLDAISGLSNTGLLSRTGAGTYATRTATGTADRIDVTNGDGVSGNPTIDIAATYAGQSSINTVGTITTGTWEGSVIDEAYLDIPDDIVTFADTLDGSGTIATKHDVNSIQGYTVTNSADNRMITSVDENTGNAEENLTFDGTDLNIVTGGLDIGGTEVISSGRAISGTTLGLTGNITGTGTFHQFGSVSANTVLELVGSSTNSEVKGSVRFRSDVTSRYSQIQGYRGSVSNEMGLYLKTYNAGEVTALDISPNGDVDFIGSLTGTTGTFSGDITQSGNTYTHTTRQGILVNGNNTIGLNQLGGGIIFSEVNGTTGGNSGAAIYAKQTASDNNEVGIAFSTHGATAGDPRVERLVINGNGSISTNGNSLTAGAITGTTVTTSGGLGIGTTADANASIRFGERTTPGLVANTSILWRNSSNNSTYISTSSVSSAFVLDDSGNATLSGAATVNGFTNSAVAGTGERIKTATSTGVEGTIANGTEGQSLQILAGGGLGFADPSGNVTGPGTSTDEAIVRFDGTSGDVIQNQSVVKLTDAGDFYTDSQPSPGVEMSFDATNDAIGRFRINTSSGTNMGFNSQGSMYLQAAEDINISTSNLTMTNTASVPASSITNGIILYAEDVTASSELKVRDEAGNITVLSPHNFSGIPEGPSEEMAWSFYSERDGKYVNVDMLKLARLVEMLTGEKLVYTGEIKNK